MDDDNTKNYFTFTINFLLLDQDLLSNTVFLLIMKIFPMSIIEFFQVQLPSIKYQNIAGGFSFF